MQIHEARYRPANDTGRSSHLKAIRRNGSGAPLPVVPTYFPSNPFDVGSQLVVLPHPLVQEPRCDSRLLLDTARSQKYMYATLLLLFLKLVALIQPFSTRVLRQ